MSNEEAKLLAGIRVKRGLLRLRAHLGTMEARSQWESLEPQWKELMDRTEASCELEDFGRRLARELKKGYERLEAAMKEVGHQASGPCLEPKEVKQSTHKLWDGSDRPMGAPAEDGLRTKSILNGRRAEKPPTDLAGGGIEEDGFPEPNWN